MNRDRGRKDKPEDPHGPNDQPDPLEGRPDESQHPFPRENTEAYRERKPGTLTREEIRERTHRNKG